MIDDEKIVGDMAKMSLEQEGYEVETFLSAEPALARLKEKRFQVVVTDYKMKGIDGMEVLRTVKRDHPDTTVIMITAFANLDAAIEALRGDVHDFFPEAREDQGAESSIRQGAGHRRTRRRTSVRQSAIPMKRSFFNSCNRLSSGKGNPALRKSSKPSLSGSSGCWKATTGPLRR